MSFEDLVLYLLSDQNTMQASGGDSMSSLIHLLTKFPLVAYYICALISLYAATFSHGGYFSFLLCYLICSGC